MLQVCVAPPGAVSTLPLVTGVVVVKPVWVAAVAMVGPVAVAVEVAVSAVVVAPVVPAQLTPYYATVAPPTHPRALALMLMVLLVLPRVVGLRVAVAVALLPVDVAVAVAGWGCLGCPWRHQTTTATTSPTDARACWCHWHGSARLVRWPATWRHAHGRSGVHAGAPIRTRHTLTTTYVNEPMNQCQAPDPPTPSSSSWVTRVVW